MDMWSNQEQCFKNQLGHRPGKERESTFKGLTGVEQV